MGNNPRIDFNPRTQGIVHPEQKNDREFFLGNFDPLGIEKLQKDWSTLRVGEIAYDSNGLPYPKTILPQYRPLPVFVDRNEALEKRNKLYVTGSGDPETQKRARKELIEKQREIATASKRVAGFFNFVCIIGLVALLIGVTFLWQEKGVFFNFVFSLTLSAILMFMFHIYKDIMNKGEERSKRKTAK